jgi:two-component system, chemotaxis family, protein-glutamate methylesterase/glutaminase
MSRRYELVVVGTSWGGLHALEILASGLPRGFSLPIVAVQHRMRDSDESLSVFLQSLTPLSVREAEDKDDLLPGTIYIAPPDYHTLVEPGHIALSTEAPVLFSRPSIDVLFESAADAYRERVVGVILTGANEDGTKGLRKIRAAGGYTVVQDPHTAESPTMPASAVAGVDVHRVLPLSHIAPFLVELAQ